MSYGDGIIKKYSKRLTSELKRGYSERNLRNMRQFYIVCEKWQTVSAILSWSHFCELLPLENLDEIKKELDSSNSVIVICYFINK